jgi:hypothetical protein
MSLPPVGERLALAYRVPIINLEYQTYTKNYILQSNECCKLVGINKNLIKFGKVTRCNRSVAVAIMEQTAKYVYENSDGNQTRESKGNKVYKMY